MTTTVTPTALPGTLDKNRSHVGKHKGLDVEQAAPPVWVRIVVPLICLLWMIPAIGLVVTSVRGANDALNTGWWTLFGDPAQFGRLTLHNFSQAATQAGLWTAMVNSFAITLPATVIPILIAAFAAYAFTFMQFRGREVLFVLVVSLLVVPNQVAFVPLLKLYGDFHLNGKFASVWLAHTGFAMSLAIYLLRNYMVTLPKEIPESAKMDGASHFQTFWRLIIPMSVPALASFAIFQFLWVWNDFLVALIFIGPGPNQPLTVALTNLVGQLGQGWQLVTAGGLITMVVPIAVFLVLQRFFVRGLTAGSVKG